VRPLGGGERLNQTIDETVSMCPYLFPDADYDGIFLATIFLTLGFLVDDIFDGVDVYKAFRSSKTGKYAAKDLKQIRANPRILVEGMLAGTEMIRDPKHKFSFPDGVSGQVFLHNAFRNFSRRLHKFGERSPHFSAWVEDFYDALVRFSKSHASIYV